MFIISQISDRVTCLALQGFDVTIFTDALKVLKGIQTKASDLVITDVVLPGLSKMDLAIVARDSCPACTVLLFSWYNPIPRKF
jgi:DNA-binding NtrC family response regulator